MTGKLIHLRDDEVSQMVNLYNKLRFVEELPLRVQTAFEKIQEQENYEEEE
jgi:hypothetical protein